MKEWPRGGLIGRTVHALKDAGVTQIPLYAANAGYFIVLALFPALLLMLSLLRYTPMQVEDLLDVLSGLLPEALMGAAEGLVVSTYRNASGTVAGFAALMALWSSSQGIYGLITGLNAIYGVAEHRGFLLTRALSLLYALVFQLLVMITLVLHVFGNSLLAMLPGIDHPVVYFLSEVLNVRIVLLLILQTLVFTLMYMALPNRLNGFLSSLPGGVLTAGGWMVFSNGYSVYVENFPRYANIYGSVYAVALSMLWLYFCLNIFFCGGALNCLLMKRKEG